MEKFGLSFDHLPIVSKVKAPVIEYEFQEICLECEAYFGKSNRIWSIPHRVGVTNPLMRHALKECKTRNKPFLNYFIKIITNHVTGQNSK